MLSDYVFNYFIALIFQRPQIQNASLDTGFAGYFRISVFGTEVVLRMAVSITTVKIVLYLSTCLNLSFPMIRVNFLERMIDEDSI